MYPRDSLPTGHAPRASFWPAFGDCSFSFCFSLPVSVFYSQYSLAKPVSPITTDWNVYLLMRPESWQPAEWPSASFEAVS